MKRSGVYKQSKPYQGFRQGLQFRAGTLHNCSNDHPFSVIKTS